MENDQIYLDQENQTTFAAKNTEFGKIRVRSTWPPNTPSNSVHSVNSGFYFVQPYWFIAHYFAARDFICIYI